MKSITFSFLLALGVVCVAPQTSHAMNSFDSCVDVADGIVLLDGRRGNFGQHSFYVVRTLVGVEPDWLNTMLPMSPDDDHLQRLMLLDETGHPLHEQLEDGCTNTADVRDGWVELSGAARRQRFTEFEERGRQMGRERERQRSLLKTCQKNPGTSCPGLPDTTRGKTEIDFINRELKASIEKATLRCKPHREVTEFRGRLFIQPDGSVTAGLLQLDTVHPADSVQSINCIRPQLAQVHFRKYEGNLVQLNLVVPISRPDVQDHAGR